MFKNVTLSFLFFLSASISLAEEINISVVDKIYKSSVMIHANDCFGSGVAFKNGNHMFIWTAAHVLESSKDTEKFINVETQKIEFKVTFKDIYVSQDIYEDGRKVGRTTRYGKVIKSSLIEDIALIKLYGGGNWPEQSCEFAKDTPKKGETLYHIGNFYGDLAPGAFSRLNFSQHGLLRKLFTPNNTDKDSVVFDHVTGVAHPGSSGGGVFNTNSDIVGLVSQFSGPSTNAQGSFLIIPSRRIKDFSEKQKIDWAFDKSKKVPYDMPKQQWADLIKIE